jgi:hypothetical protein
MTDSEDLGRATGLTYAQMRTAALMRETSEPRKRKRGGQKNPRPQQTTNYRIQKVAEQTLEVRRDHKEVAMRTWQLDQQPQNQNVSSEFWRKNYEVR